MEKCCMILMKGILWTNKNILQLSTKKIVAKIYDMRNLSHILVHFLLQNLTMGSEASQSCSARQALILFCFRSYY